MLKRQVVFYLLGIDGYVISLVGKIIAKIPYARCIRGLAYRVGKYEDTCHNYAVFVIEPQKYAFFFYLQKHIVPLRRLTEILTVFVYSNTDCYHNEKHFFTLSFVHTIHVVLSEGG